MNNTVPVFPQLPPVAEITHLGGNPENTLSGEWPDRFYKNITSAELHSYKVENPRAMALLCAGGGYTSLMYDKEGVEVALWLNSLNIDAHVLVHRLPGAPDGFGGNFGKNASLDDGIRAIEFLAGGFPKLPLIHVGLSSGGHLASVLSCNTEQIKARGVLVGYAPLNSNHRLHKFPPDKPDYEPVEKQDFYDDWPIGLTEYKTTIPSLPIFLAYALMDDLVPVQHALRFVATAAQLGLDLDAHVFGSAPHGFALRGQSGSHLDWPLLAAHWVDRILNYSNSQSL